MLTDDDLSALQEDFGVLASKSDCVIRKGTTRATSGVIAGPYTTYFDWTCTVLNLAGIKDAYLQSFAKSMVQATKNPRVILLPLPLPTGKDILRGYAVRVGTDDFMILDLDNNDTYQLQRVAFCQYVEGGIE